MSVLDVFKMLPGSNCGECGQPTCLAFATQVIKEGQELERCPYLPEEQAAAAAAVKSQQAEGMGRRRESVAIALEALQEKVAPLDFAAIAEGLGAVYGETGGRPYLEVPYFGRILRIFKDQVQYPPGSRSNPWEAIFLYNYLASQGSRPLTGDWIAFQSLPNSVSKVKTLERLQRELAEQLQGRKTGLLEKIAALRGELTDLGEDAEVKAVFRPLPKVPILFLFWDADSGENFPAQVRFLFDAAVADYLDLESLLFLVESLAQRLQEAA
ncbi:MAG: DUF3786 domain-containing protein [Deltaproteobacteria bacterium]|nr:DUF3786 domain-containing protein [Deltaproteobacteria bacterium]